MNLSEDYLQVGGFRETMGGVGMTFKLYILLLVTVSPSYSVVTKGLGLRTELAGFESWICFRSKLFILFVSVFSAAQVG